MGRTPLLLLLALALVPAPAAQALTKAQRTERREARLVGAAVAPWATLLPEADRIAAGAVGDRGDAIEARCGASIEALRGLPAERRGQVATGLAALHESLVTIPAAFGVLLGILQPAQEDLQDVALSRGTLRTARTLRRRALKEVAALAGREEDLCVTLAPWAADGFTTDRSRPSFQAILAANRRAATNLDVTERTLGPGADPRRREGERVLTRAGIGPRVRKLFSLRFTLPETSVAIGDDAVKRHLRRVARAQ